MPPALWIATSDELSEGLRSLSESDFVAIDTEFMRERTYYATLCLIQAATPKACVIIDPLSISDLTPLWQFLQDRSRIKVLHSARQDLEVLSLAIGRSLQSDLSMPRIPAVVPGPIFDTQIAAALLGSPAQIGYATLVAERLNHSLPKGQTRTDWSRRPLSEEQLTYAADDVRYLVELYSNLTTELQARGRMQWLTEEAAELEDVSLYRVEPSDAWRRLKGLDRLQPQQRATAKLLAEWREERAMHKDLPRGWILADESLRDIAESLPNTPEQMERVRGLSANFLRKRTDEMLAMVRHGQSNASNEAPAFAPPRPDPRLQSLVSRLLTLIREEAARSGIAPELLATRRDAEQLVFSGRTEHLLRGWRRGVIGERLVNVATEALRAIPQSG